MDGPEIHHALRYYNDLFILIIFISNEFTVSELWLKQKNDEDLLIVLFHRASPITPGEIRLLSEQGDTALFQLYKPYTHTNHFEIARQRSARARKPPQRRKERPWKPEILSNPNSENLLIFTCATEPWR